MANEDKILVPGTVSKILPGTKFEVTLENGHVVVCTLSGKLRMNQIRVLVGDKVDVEMSLYDITKGRVIWRYK